VSAYYRALRPAERSGRQGVSTCRLAVIFVAGSRYCTVCAVSDVFVAPFRGILGINEVQAGAAAFDVAALVALIGWVIIELIVFGLVRVFRPAGTA